MPSQIPQPRMLSGPCVYETTAPYTALTNVVQGPLQVYEERNHSSLSKATRVYSPASNRRIIHPVLA